MENTDNSQDNSEPKSQRLPRVALVGRPNVGKSTLFNRLVGKRRAIVAEVAGTTRDRLDQQLNWKSQEFILTDMAGLEPTLGNGTEITKAAQAQVKRGLALADLVVWVVDANRGAEPTDHQVATLLRSLAKPVLVAVNKADNSKLEVARFDFYQFGYGEPSVVSALHGKGREALLDRIVQTLQEMTPIPVEAEVEDSKEINISIVGRPNVGKSTLLNALAGDERVVVSAEAGTTRDSVDTVIPAKQLFFRTFTKWRAVRIVDTAGIRKPGKIGRDIESWSVIRSLEAVDRSEVVLFMIDAEEGLVHQDLKVVSQIIKAGRPLIFILNKWDKILAKKNLVPGTEEDGREQERYLDSIRVQAPFLHWAQVLFISASEGINVSVIGQLVLKAYNAWSLKLSDDDLKEVAEVLQHQENLKNLQKITLEHSCPPVFHLHIEGKKLPHFTTTRSVENVLRQRFNIGPTPIKIWTVTSIKKRA